MPEARFLKVVIIALLLLNAGTIGFLLLRHPPRNDGRAPLERDERGRRGAAAFIYRELNLTDDQETRYKAMRDEHHEAVESVRDQMRANETKMYRLLGTADSSGNALKASVLMDSVAVEQREIEELTFAHFREFRAICTPAQQKRFDEVISEALRRM